MLCPIRNVCIIRGCQHYSGHYHACVEDQEHLSWRENIPKFSLAKIFKLYPENGPRNPHTGQRDRVTINENDTGRFYGKKRPDRSGKTNLTARRRRDWWVHSIIANHPRTTNRPPPTQNNLESKWQNEPQRTTRRTTSRTCLFQRHAGT